MWTKMGNEQSRPGARRPPKHKAPPKRMSSVRADPEGSYLLISNENVEVFKFDPQQTFMVAYAIDKQISPNFAHRTLSAATVVDAYQVCMAMIDKKVVPEDHVRLFTASKHTDMCTMQGMKESFLEQAKKVGKNGLFLFHFSGHGIKVQNEWGLAPADFDYTDVTYLTSPILNHWLYEAECKAQHILFTLDCCYAGGLADELTAKDLELRPGLYVLSACTAFETSLVIGPLGHSIFAYFLAYALRVIRFPPGKLPVSLVFEECGALCTALSSLLISYNPTFGLKFGTMQPELRYFDLQSTITHWVKESLKSKQLEAASYDTAPGRYNFVTKYFQGYDEEKHQLDSLCLQWLETLAGKKSPLGELAKRDLLRDEVLSATVCSIMWSVASIQMQRDRDTVNDPNIFLLGFLHAAAATDHFHGVQLTLEHVKESWGFYQAVVVANKISDSELQQLYKEISAELGLYTLKKQVSLEKQISIEESMGESKSIVMQSIQPQKLEQYLSRGYRFHAASSFDELKSEGAEVCSIASSWWVPLSPDDVNLPSTPASDSK